MQGNLNALPRDEAFVQWSWRLLVLWTLSLLLALSWTSGFWRIEPSEHAHVSPPRLIELAQAVYELSDHHVMLERVPTANDQVPDAYLVEVHPQGEPQDLHWALVGQRMEWMSPPFPKDRAHLLLEHGHLPPPRGHQEALAQKQAPTASSEASEARQQDESTEQRQKTTDGTKHGGQVDSASPGASQASEADASTDDQSLEAIHDRILREELKRARQVAKEVYGEKPPQVQTSRSASAPNVTNNPAPRRQQADTLLPEYMLSGSAGSQDLGAQRSGSAASSGAMPVDTGTSSGGLSPSLMTSPQAPAESASSGGSPSSSPSAETKEVEKLIAQAQPNGNIPMEKIRSFFKRPLIPIHTRESHSKALYVFLDPRCPHSHEYYRWLTQHAERFEQADVNVLGVPVSVLESGDKALKLAGTLFHRGAVEKMFEQGKMPSIKGKMAQEKQWVAQATAFLLEVDDQKAHTPTTFWFEEGAPRMLPGKLSEPVVSAILDRMGDN